MKKIFVLLVVSLLASFASALQKNVASQKIGVYAHDTSADTPKTGDAGNITAYIWQDWTSGAASNDTNPTELDSTNAPGIYVFDVQQGETNADVVCLYAKSSTGNIQLDVVIVHTTPPNFPDTALSTLTASDNIGINWGDVSNPTTSVGLSNTTIGTATVTGTVNALANNVITTASINDGAITDAKVANDVQVDVVTIETGDATDAINTEADNAVVTYKLDHLVYAADGDDPADNSIMAMLAATGGDWSTFVKGDDSLQAQRDRGDAGWITADVSGLSTHDAAAVKTAIEAGGSTLAQILADSGELQTNQGNWLTATSVDLEDDAITAAKITDAAWHELIELLFDFDATATYATANAGSMVKQLGSNATVTIPPRIE